MKMVDGSDEVGSNMVTLGSSNPAGKILTIFNNASATSEISVKGTEKKIEIPSQSVDTILLSTLPKQDKYTLLIVSNSSDGKKLFINGDAETKFSAEDSVIGPFIIHSEGKFLSFF